MAVQGTRHQANIRSNGGAQCTIIAFTALLFASFILSPSEWTSSSVDRVLYAGDDLYTGIVDSNYGGDHTHVFGHDEVPHIVHVLGRPYHTNNLNTFYFLFTVTRDCSTPVTQPFSVCTCNIQCRNSCTCNF